MDRPPSILRHPSFAFYWFSRVLATIAFQMQAVAVAWQLYALTGSALDLGLVGLCQFTPMMCLTLLVGQVADRYDRRVVVSICQMIVAGAAATLAAGSFGGWLTKAPSRNKVSSHQSATRSSWQRELAKVIH